MWWLTLVVHSYKIAFARHTYIYKNTNTIIINSRTVRATTETVREIEN